MKFSATDKDLHGRNVLLLFAPATYVRTYVLAQCHLKSPDCSVTESGAVTKVL